MAAMTWDGPFIDVDPLSLQIMVQMQLEDSEELAALSKGKQREGTVSDAQLAMQMYVEDLRNADSYLKDRTMAQSAAMAILQDGNLIAEAYRQEQQAARDHEMAMRLDARAQDNAGAGPAPRDYNRRPSKKQKKTHKDPWEDPEMLEKVAAIYMRAPDAPDTSAPPVNYDSDGTVAESSTWAASRQTNSKRPLRPCVACTEEKDFFELIRVPCDHEYCRDCLENLFSMSMKDESLFPPRCDNQEITLDWVRLFISSKVAKEFEAKYDELSTKIRSYCHEPTCATFIPEEWITGDIATCPKCMKTTCTTCKNPSHSGNCPEDEALHQLLDTANAEQWQRCYQCTAVVELEQGCNHMRCRCGADFCYVCSLKWKTCACEQWDEPRLFRRAEQLVDRNPNRRLFEPARVEHQQPATRPATPDSPRIDPTTTHQPAVFRSQRPLHMRRQSTKSAGSLTSAYESDFSDHSEWEHHSWIGDFQQQPPVDPDPVEEHPPAISPPTVQPAPAPEMPDMPQPGVDETRSARIRQAIEHLRTNHACTHDKWRYRKGRHQCEECRSVLREYIFECRHCSLQACNRCRRNRL